MSVEVSVDPELCIGSGDCSRIAPDAFWLDDDVYVARPTPAAATSDLERLLEAARSCPTQAIRILRGQSIPHDSNPGLGSRGRHTSG